MRKDLQCAASVKEKYSYQFIVRKKHCSDVLLQEWETEPIRLEASDPIGF